MAGCTISEVCDDQVKARARSALQELAQSSKQFCDILCHWSNEVSIGEPVCEQLFDEFLTVTLPSGSRSPLTVFSGTPERPVVIISQISPRTRQEDLTEDSRCEEQPACFHLDEFVLSTRSSMVVVGQSFPDRLGFLTCSQPFHQNEKSDTRVSHTLHARDIGLLPVSMEKARFLCSLYNVGSQRWSVVLPDIWVLCQDGGNRVVLGCSQGDSTSSLRVLEISKAGVVHLPSGPPGAKKPLPSSTWKLKSHERPSSRAYCEYEVISSDSELTASDLVIQFAWGEVEHHLSPPPETSVAVLKIATKPGHMGSSVLGLYEEVLTLLNLCLVATGDTKWSEMEGVLEEATPLASKLEAFFEVTASPLGPPKENLSPQQSGHAHFQMRKNLDFVEHLWLFCKDVQSVGDLQEVLASVFKAVLFRKVHPWLHQGSSSPLANLFRQALLCSTSDEIRALGSKMEAMLSEAKVLHCLVQVGIEKLSRDYLDCFRSAGLVTEVHLDPFLLGGSTVLESCYNLCKLHTSLELVACAMTYLNLPLPFLSQLTREALDVYAHADFRGFETTPVFSLPVPPHSPALRGLLALCGSLVPRVWSVTTGEHHGCQMTLYATEPLFKHLTADIECNDSVTDLYVYKGCCSTFVC